VIGSIFWTVAIIVFCVSLDGMCVSFHPATITTNLSRKLNKDTCEGIAPCHVYLTLPQEASNSIIVNFHTAKGKVKDPFVVYDTVSHSDGSFSDYAFQMPAHSFRHKTSAFKRGIQWAQLRNLQYDTTYYFRAGYKNDSKHYSSEFSFRTIPQNGTLTFVAGGDSGITKTMEQINALAGAEDPYFAVLGGDLPYENGMATCYQRWDYWLHSMQNTLRTTTGHLIPMLMSIGNHEAGGYNKKSKNVPFYLKWFPQEDEAIPLKQRKSYHYHTFRNESLFVILDSGIASKPAGKQQQWLQTTLEDHQQYPLKFALYHVPMYPSRHPEDNALATLLRKVWAPLFDQYQLTASFENHEHTFKRSKRIKNNVVDETGTLYLGDGAWGVPTRVPAQDRWYLEKAEDINFFFRVDILQNSTTFTAIDTKGNVFDQVMIERKQAY
jgi:hypothetical protein